jgi:hypothetical protein
VLVDLIQPDLEALLHALLHTVGEGIQSHKEAHLVLLLVFAVDAAELFQVDVVISDIPVVLFQESGKLPISIQHVSS